jgi:hypothetical protein
MVGWKRIVVTVGEKIGKTHLTYAQGASAELVAMGTIFGADHLGLPVSTTHVLSSGVAGTMAANRSGCRCRRSATADGLGADPAGIDPAGGWSICSSRRYSDRGPTHGDEGDPRYSGFVPLGMQPGLIWGCDAHGEGTRLIENCDSPHEAASAGFTSISPIMARALDRAGGGAARADP